MSVEYFAIWNKEKMKFLSASIADLKDKPGTPWSLSTFKFKNVYVKIWKYFRHQVVTHSLIEVPVFEIIFLINKKEEARFTKVIFFMQVELQRVFY